jgi:antitoxin PrlF
MPMKRQKTDRTIPADLVTSIDDVGTKAKRRSRLMPLQGSRILDQSRITSKGQITLPKTVRASLGVSEGQSVQFRSEGGKIVVESVPDSPCDDPAIGAFLDLLGQDIATGNVLHVPIMLKEMMDALTKEIEFDPDEAIDGDVVI